MTRYEVFQIGVDPDNLVIIVKGDDMVVNGGFRVTRHKDGTTSLPGDRSGKFGVKVGEINSLKSDDEYNSIIERFIKERAELEKSGRRKLENGTVTLEPPRKTRRSNKN